MLYQLSYRPKCNLVSNVDGYHTTRPTTAQLFFRNPGFVVTCQSKCHWGGRNELDKGEEREREH